MLKPKNQLVIAFIIISLTFILGYIVSNKVRINLNASVLSRCENNGAPTQLCSCVYDNFLASATYQEKKKFYRGERTLGEAIDIANKEVITANCNDIFKEEFRRRFLNACVQMDPQLNEFCDCVYDSSFSRIQTSGLIDFYVNPDKANTLFSEQRDFSFLTCKKHMPIKYQK